MKPDIVLVENSKNISFYLRKSKFCLFFKYNFVDYPGIWNKISHLISLLMEKRQKKRHLLADKKAFTGRLLHCQLVSENVRKGFLT